MCENDYLTEDEVIQGVANYLLHKGKLRRRGSLSWQTLRQRNMVLI